MTRFYVNGQGVAYTYTIIQARVLVVQVSLNSTSGMFFVGTDTNLMEEREFLLDARFQS